jgi:hypothetical protein
MSVVGMVSTGKVFGMNTIMGTEDSVCSSLLLSSQSLLPKEERDCGADGGRARHTEQRQQQRVSCTSQIPCRCVLCIVFSQTSLGLQLAPR